MHRVYLDHNARSPLLPGAQRAMQDAMALMGNPSSTHREGQAARAALEQARMAVGRLLHADPKGTVFTSGATESLHLAMQGALSATPRTRVVTATTEHHAVLHELERLAVAGRIQVTLVPVLPDGQVDLDAWKDALKEDVALAVLMAANNESGVVHPYARALGLARRVGAFTILDAAQVAGRSALVAEETRADAICLSGSKLGGPAGVGALWMKQGCAWKPPRQGGSQERARRPGTENVLGVVGLGAAAAEVSPAAWDATAPLRDRLQEGVKALAPDAVVFGGEAPRLPNTLFAAFPGADAQALVMLMDQHGVAVSSGSACVSGASQPSHVLRAMGASESLARSCLRFSLGPPNTDEDVERALVALRDALPRSRLAP